MNRSSLVSFVVRGVASLVVAIVSWVFLGYLATAPLGAIYGWSGHLAIPDAPLAVYVGLYLVVLPVLCLSGVWKAASWIGARRAARRSHASGA